MFRVVCAVISCWHRTSCAVFFTVSTCDSIGVCISSEVQSKHSCRLSVRNCSVATTYGTLLKMCSESLCATFFNAPTFLLLLLLVFFLHCLGLLSIGSVTLVHGQWRSECHGNCWKIERNKCKRKHFKSGIVRSNDMRLIETSIYSWFDVTYDQTCIFSRSTICCVRYAICTTSKCQMKPWP